MSKLFSRFTIGGLNLTNRIVIAPMCQYSARDGEATDWHLIHLGQLALSGAGLLIVEATAVTPEGRITPADLGLYSDSTESALAQVIKRVKAYSDIPFAIQLSHAGRKGSSAAPWEGGALLSPSEGGWPTLAPSAIPHAQGETPPLVLDRDGLARIRQAFVDSARRADRIGFDAIELHAAHGYLLHQFLSPLSNRREDEYGGSIENRMRFPLEIFDAVRQVVSPDKPVGMRLSASDWVEGGWCVEQSVQFAKALEARGGAFIHVSSGGVSSLQQIPIAPGYQIGFAERIRASVGMPVIGVGLITEPEQAEDVIASGQADLVAIARAILFEPHWPWRAAAALGAQVKAPKQYWRSQPRELKQLFGDVRIAQR